MQTVLKAFEEGRARHVKIGTLKPGALAIILSLNFNGAIVVEIQREDRETTGGPWVEGHVVYPSHLATVAVHTERHPVTFNRKHDALALPLTAEEFVALREQCETPTSVA